MSRGAVAACVVLLTACAASTPDTVLLNGKVFPADPTHLWCEAIAIKGERVTAVGSAAEIGAQASSPTRHCDLRGRTLVPGFNDAHVHAAPRPPKTQVAVPDDPSSADVEKAIVEANHTAPPEKDKGHLSPGALADLAVLSADVFEAPANQLPQIVSVLTRVGGHIEHDSGAVRRS